MRRRLCEEHTLDVTRTIAVTNCEEGERVAWTGKAGGGGGGGGGGDGRGIAMDARLGERRTLALSVILRSCE